MIKLSHSGKNRYQTCGKSYELRYIDKLVSRQKGSALFFGSAIDIALNYMLEHKDEKNVLEVSRTLFQKEWTNQKDNKYDLVYLPDCEDISYFKSDFDPLLLTDADWKKLPENILGIREEVEASKKLGGWYTELTLEQRKAYNYSCWISLHNKGMLFIDAYYKQIIPLIKQTIAVQMELDLSDGVDAKMTGFIDAVVELQDGRVCVLDNKTSSIKYAQESVANSEQLALYQAILNIHATDENHPWNTRIDVCGYAVLSKKLRKETTKICLVCGHSGKGSHTTCESKIGKKRCGGEWTTTYKFSVDTQFIVDIVPEMIQDQVLTNAENVIEAIQHKHFPQNFDACHGIYGRCEYYNLCHEGLMDNLIDIKDKKRD